MIKKIALVAALVLPLAAGSCQDDAQIATQNLIKEADNFGVYRNIKFYNAILDVNMLEIEGLCSFNTFEGATAANVICKIAAGNGPDSYVRHTLILSDNTSVIVEQIGGIAVSAYHYRFTFKPQAIIPDIDFRGDAGELTTNSSEMNQK